MKVDLFPGIRPTPSQYDCTTHAGVGKRCLDLSHLARAPTDREIPVFSVIARNKTHKESGS